MKKLAAYLRGLVADANLAMGLVDRKGDRMAFGNRVAEMVGKRNDKRAGSFKAIKLSDYIEANPPKRGGDAIGVITVAGEIIDGKAGPGHAAGDTVLTAHLPQTDNPQAGAELDLRLKADSIVVLQDGAGV